MDETNDFFDTLKSSRGESKTKSLIKWAGGKGRLLPSLVPTFLSQKILRDGNCYIEPFAGSCSVAFCLNFNKMLLNDKNIKLMNFFRQVKIKPEKLFKKIVKCVKEYEASIDKEKFYYDIREKYNKLTLVKGNGVTHASMFWFLNKTGFNGMYRETSAGQFNIPYGQRDCPIPNLENFIKVSRILQKCHLYNKPFETICEMAKPYDVLYLDPPYIPVSKTASFSSYLRYGFDLNDHKKLCKIMQELSDKNVYVVMSNSSCALTKEIYGELRDFNSYDVEVTRLISGTAKGRGKIKEVIITNAGKFKNENDSNK